MISVFFSAMRLSYPADFVYEHEGAYHLSNLPKPMHADERAKIFAIIPTCTPCIIQNDDALKPVRPKRKTTKSKI